MYKVFYFFVYPWFYLLQEYVQTLYPVYNNKEVSNCFIAQTKQGALYTTFLHEAGGRLNLWFGWRHLVWMTFSVA